MHPRDAAGMANSVDPDQFAPSGQEQSDLGLLESLFHKTLIKDPLKQPSKQMFSLLLSYIVRLHQNIERS